MKKASMIASISLAVFASASASLAQQTIPLKKDVTHGKRHKLSKAPLKTTTINPAAIGSTPSSSDIHAKTAGTPDPRFNDNKTPAKYKSANSKKERKH